MWSTLFLLLVVGGVREAQVSADDVSDTAPFMLLIEHQDGRHCAASLVSQRTALTTVECAWYVSGEMLAWAAAARANGENRDVAARRVTRIVTANSGALALLELNDTFPAEAHVTPIRMAEEDSRECNELGRVCFAVRAQYQTGRAPRLHIVNAFVAQSSICAPADMDRGFCLTGAEMCTGDWGAGAVCGDKLCGVVAGATTEGCGRTLIAHNVARHRRFLHCAHVLNSCEREECVNECKELQLNETTDVTERDKNIPAKKSQLGLTSDAIMGRDMQGYMTKIDGA